MFADDGIRVDEAGVCVLNLSVLARVGVNSWSEQIRCLYTLMTLYVLSIKTPIKKYRRK